jgi:hypothetical protein
MIDSVLFEDFGGFVLGLDVTNTGPAQGILCDTFMSWFVLAGSGETSFVF